MRLGRDPWQNVCGVVPHSCTPQRKTRKTPLFLFLSHAFFFHQPIVEICSEENKTKTHHGAWNQTGASHHSKLESVKRTHFSPLFRQNYAPQMPTIQSRSTSEVFDPFRRHDQRRDSTKVSCLHGAWEAEPVVYPPRHPH